MSKHPHIYSFRLSDADDQSYRALLKRFHLDLRNENSGTFRLFIKNLSEFFREFDAAAQEDSEEPEEQGHSFTPIQEQRHFQPDGEEPEEKPWMKAMYADVKQNQARLQRLAMAELREKGLSMQHLNSKMAQLSKKLGINYSIHQYDWDEFHRQWLRKRKEARKENALAVGIEL